MGDWNLLRRILEEVHIHSTVVGKIWLTILFIFRMLLLGVAAEDVWDDEQSAFICNTEQPGCQNVCYDLAFPISLIRYWVLQIVSVSSPSLVYMGHALYCLRTLEKERHRKRVQVRAELGEAELLPEEHRRMERELRNLEQQKTVKKAPLRGSLLSTYVLHILTRSAVEVGFIVGQYVLYGFGLDPLYKCERQPCPNSVDCFVSRPTEKTIFMVFMQVIAGVSLFLNILEISHLGARKIKQTLYGRQGVDYDNYEDNCKVKTKPTMQQQYVLRSLYPVTQATFKVLPEWEMDTLPAYLSSAGCKSNEESPNWETGENFQKITNRLQPQQPARFSEGDIRTLQFQSAESQDHLCSGNEEVPRNSGPQGLCGPQTLRASPLLGRAEILVPVLCTSAQPNSCRSCGERQDDSPEAGPVLRGHLESRPASVSSSLGLRTSSGSELNCLSKEIGEIPMTPPPNGRGMSMANRAKREVASDLVI